MIPAPRWATHRSARRQILADWADLARQATEPRPFNWLAAAGVAGLILGLAAWSAASMGAF